MHLDLTAWDLDHIDSSIVCCYYDVVLRSDDLQLLSPGRWLNDTCIEFFYEYLERQIVQTDEILLMRPAIAHMIAQSTSNEYLSVLPPQLHERAVIFLPINNHTCADTPGGSHWALLVYTRDTGTFYYYDTMNISNLSAARNMAAKAAKVLNVKHPKFLMMPTPQQDNGYDCGVYVISITELICRRLLQTSLVSKYKSDGGLRTKSGADECKDDFAGLLKRRPASASDGDIRMWRQEAEKCLEQRLRMSEFDLPSTIRTRQFLRELVVNYCEIRNPSSDSQ
ncbi:hypothetical protein BDF22DRAFT_617341 [Syncephalis plumigaleata]|nr:hypothetical protein BDF22DRAFT_617341 [Syncephalis plumigaleata]